MHSQKPVIMRFTPFLRRFPDVAFDSVLNSSGVPVIDDGPRSLVLLRKVVESFLFPRLSPAGDRLCDVLGFVPAGSVRGGGGSLKIRMSCFVPLNSVLFNF